jgi:hypothetical protein
MRDFSQPLYFLMLDKVNAVFYIPILNLLHFMDLTTISCFIEWLLLKHWDSSELYDLFTEPIVIFSFSFFTKCKHCFAV